MKIPWFNSKEKKNEIHEKKQDLPKDKQLNKKNQSKVSELNIDGSRYDMNSLSDEIKELVKFLQFADKRVKLQEQKISLLARGRKSIYLKLSSKLTNASELHEEN